MSSELILRADFPDPDVIRVEDTYYMVSTTMHFMPGGVILRSYDLLHWEIVTHIYQSLDSTEGQRLIGGKHIYGKGMWAPSFCYHNNIFYVCFAVNDTKKTYLFTAEDIEGPWKKQYIEGFYHDCSLLFDEERIFIIYGNTEIHLTELDVDLKGPKAGGLDRIIVRESGESCLGFEGSHIYKINGKYYAFFIHSPGSEWFRTQACYVSDSLDGKFTGGDVLRNDLNYCSQGTAQGGIVDTPDGDWFGILFQDRGAVGRIPVLIPITWVNDFPVFEADGKIPMELLIKSTRPDYIYEPLFMSDDFNYPLNNTEPISLKKVWEFNHEPDNRLWSVTERPGAFRIRSGIISNKLEEAVNVLTQRLMFPGCEITVTLDARGLNTGDYAGLCALQGCFGFIAIKKEEDGIYLVMFGKKPEDLTLEGKAHWDQGTEYGRIRMEEEVVTLKMRADFDQMKDEAEFYYKIGEGWEKLGITQKLYFKMDHFTGCRAGLFLYSTKQTGGKADFMDFQYNILNKSGDIKMKGAFYTGEYRNVFNEYGYSEEEIDKKLTDIFHTIFYGSEEERLYHLFGSDMGYIEDTGNHDVRTEGMSYGMMFCVQMDRKEEFDRIWKWAKTYMYMEEGENSGYFAWSCGVDGSGNASGPAPDGEEFFAMALYFASHRWGDGEGIFCYSEEANKLLSTCIHKGEDGIGCPMWEPTNHLIKFVPDCDFTDPSYHLPHFYYLFSLWANLEDREFWKKASCKSREYLRKACHPVTGMSPEYAQYDGTPVYGVEINNQRHDWYYSDSYRTIANIGLDYEWFAADEWQKEAAGNLQRFYCEEGSWNGVYEIDGTLLEEKARHPIAVAAVNAQSALASDVGHTKNSDYTKKCVRDFWETPLRAGKNRYYDNCLYLFAFLALSGNYKIWKPVETQ